MPPIVFINSCVVYIGHVVENNALFYFIFRIMSSCGQTYSVQENEIFTISITVPSL